MALAVIRVKRKGYKVTAVEVDGITLPATFGVRFEHEVNDVGRVWVGFNCLDFQIVEEEE